jgi:chromosome segregation ATPase
MELDPKTIEGDWARFGDEEYFVYTTGKMSSFCIIGAHEPCFSVSSFFSKNDDIYNTQIEKFSSLLSDLKTVVEEAEENKEGGEQPMNDFENQELETQVVDPQNEETIVSENFEEKTPTVEESTVTETTEPVVEENFEVVETVEQVEETSTEPSEFETLQTQFNELQESYNQLQENLNTAQARIEELEAFQNSANTELETLRSTNAEL